MLSICGVFIFILGLGYVQAAKFLEDSALQLTVLQAISKFDEAGTSSLHRSLSIYNIDQKIAEDSPDITENNIKLFFAAVASHTTTVNHQAFYIFCVVGGAQNSLSRLLPADLPNSAYIKASGGHRDLVSHVHTVSILGDSIVSKFNTILFINQDARGPFEDRDNGKWWKRIVNLFDQNPKLGIMGPMISCEIQPHVQTHAFAMRSNVALEVMSEFYPERAAGKRNKNRHLEISLSADTIDLGYSISSLYYHNKFNRTVFSGNCEAKEGNSEVHRSNPTSWCDVDPSDALFMKFGGIPLRIRGYYCQESLDAIQRATQQIVDQEPQLKLTWPETIYGGHFHPLYKEFNIEQHRDRSVQIVGLPMSKEAHQRNENSKVCLLVRTSLMHGTAAAAKSKVVLTDVKLLAQSKKNLTLFLPPSFRIRLSPSIFPLSFCSALLRQTNPNWEAYFFVTDNQPFDEELAKILSNFGDARLMYLPIEMKYRPKVRKFENHIFSFHPIYNRWCYTDT